MAQRLLPLLPLALLVTRLASAQGPACPDSLVNTTTVGGQVRPAVASDASGGFVVVWNSFHAGSADIFDQDGSQHGIFGRRFDAAGAPQGPEFRVNIYTTGAQIGSSVGAGASGGFVVVWTSLDQDGSDGGIFGQRHDPAGVPQGPEFRVNTYTTALQSAVKVASDTAGNFVVVWVSPGDGVGSGIFAQRYDAAGTPQGAEFQVNASTAGYQSRPDVAFDDDSTGGFVVVWESADGSALGIFGRRFSASGVPEGPDFLVNAFTTDFQVTPQVARKPGGGFLAAWASEGQDGENGGIFANVPCSRYYAVTPCRVADTRNPPGPSGGPALAANTTRAFPVTGSCSIPADAQAVAFGLAAVNPTDLGNALVSGGPGGAAGERPELRARPHAGGQRGGVFGDRRPGHHPMRHAHRLGGGDAPFDVFGYFKR